MKLAKLFEFRANRENASISEVTNGEIMVCVELDYSADSDIYSLLKNKIKELYKEKAIFLKKTGTLHPAFDIRDIGELKESENPFTFKLRRRRGFCIVSNRGANPEWFEDIVRDAIKELNKEGIEIEPIITRDIPTILVVSE